MISAKSRRLHRFLVRVACLLAVGLALTPDAARADLNQTSVKLVPQDVAWYSVGLQLKQQFDMFTKSKAFERLQGGVLYRGAVMQIRNQWQNSEQPAIVQLKASLQEPDNQRLIQLLKDAMSQEIFLYGGADHAEFFKQLLRMAETMNELQIEGIRSGEEPDEEKVRQLIMDQLRSFQGNVRVPATVIGFRISDTEGAKYQLERLHKIVAQLFEQHEPLRKLQSQLIRQAFAGGDFVTLSVSGTDIPWEEIESRETSDEKSREMLKLFRSIVEPLRGAIGVGVSHGYLIVSVGTDLTHLEKLGSSPSLYDLDKLAALQSHADENIVSVSYASEEFARSIGNTERQIDSNIRMLRAGLDRAVQEGHVSEDLKRELNADVDRARNALVAWLPTPGAKLSFQFMNTHDTHLSFEGYSYDWSHNATIDATQPLSLLDHLGPEPLAFGVVRMRFDPKEYDHLRAVVARVEHYAVEIAGQHSAERLAEYQQVRDQLLPYVQRADAVLREKLIPAVGDGQVGFVLDSYTSSRQWHAQVPAAEQPLPFPHLTLIRGVRDAAAAELAYQELFHIAQEAYQKVREVVPEASEQLPWETLPQPNVEFAASGQLYSYSLPADWGIDNQLVRPHAAIGKGVMAIGFLPTSTQQILKPQRELSILNEGRFDGPLASAAYLNWSRLMEIASQWTDYGYSAWLAHEEVEPNQGFMYQMVKNQVDIMLDVLSCYQGFSATQYLENGTLVTHFQSEVRDLD